MASLLRVALLFPLRRAVRKRYSEGIAMTDRVDALRVSIVRGAQAPAAPADLTLQGMRVILPSLLVCTCPGSRTAAPSWYTHHDIRADVA